VRPFVVGKKTGSSPVLRAGAAASAGLYSLIETAKANGLEPYKYLRYLFEKLPFALSEDDYGKLLPQNLTPTDLDLGQVVTGV